MYQHSQIILTSDRSLVECDRRNWGVVIYPVNVATLELNETLLLRDHAHGGSRSEDEVVEI